VARGCPKLETFNAIKLWELSARSESRHWLGELGSYCATENKAGRVAQCVLCVSREEEEETN